jgi:hypothetical protein
MFIAMWTPNLTLTVHVKKIVTLGRDKMHCAQTKMAVLIEGGFKYMVYVRGETIYSLASSNYWES